MTQLYNLGIKEKEERKFIADMFDNGQIRLKTVLMDTYGHNTPAAVDPISACLGGIDVAHGQVHAGRMFFIDSYSDLSNGEIKDFLFVAPSIASSKEAHLLWEINWEAEGEMLVYEDVVTASLGSSVQIFNRRRDSSTVPVSSIYTAPSISSSGTLLISKRVGSGKGFGGNDRSNMELVLCCDKKYLFRFINRTTSDNLLDYQADWYEVNKFS